jgi:hypothetical protein
MAGCAGPSETFYAVAGKVTVNGEPLKNGAVSFRPDATRGNKSLHHPTGVLDAQGSYEVFTVGRKGAPPGAYKVLVLSDQNQEKGPIHPLPPVWATHVKYTQESTTDLLVEVVAKPEPGAYDFKLIK